MAFGAEAAGAKARSHTIYVWPSDELIAQSWHWPASWHAAYEHAAARIGLAVAACLLDGRPIARRRVTLELSIATVAFGVRRAGASVVVTVSAFAAPEPPRPDDPGPDGGCRQPSAADGLVLGLRGSGRSFYLAVFHGYMPAIPAENLLPCGTAGAAETVPWGGHPAGFADAMARTARVVSPFDQTRSGLRSHLRAEPEHAKRRAISLAIPVALVSAPAWSAYLNPERAICWNRLSGGERAKPGRFGDRPERRTFSLDRRVPFDWRPLPMQRTRFDYQQSRYLH